ncbi:hypothetical protein FEI14_14495 [Lacticaseibacillus zeae]|uniref:Uncharacterized protein n=1 Tax=Lacticaseibacillus zeae TaxID=57037 RepID=A0A5R8LMB7_LACZE|nr:hypothetical protein FEI14_14495 [Lacticaseibacillus zeae]
MPSNSYPLWPSRPRSLHAGFCAGDRVSEPDCPAKFIPPIPRLWPFRFEILMCRFLGLRARFGPDCPANLIPPMARLCPLRSMPSHAAPCAIEHIRNRITLPHLLPTTLTHPFSHQK